MIQKKEEKKRKKKGKKTNKKNNKKNKTIPFRLFYFHPVQKSSKTQ